MNILITLCFAVAILLSLFETAGVLKARIEGKTKSTRRVLIRAVVFVLLSVLYLSFRNQVNYNALVSHSKTLAQDIRVVNMPFLISVLAVALIIFFVLSELSNLYQAKKQGLTKNISRFVSAVIILICILPILKNSVTMWNEYTDTLEEKYVSPAEMEKEKLQLDLKIKESAPPAKATKAGK